MELIYYKKTTIPKTAHGSFWVLLFVSFFYAVAEDFIPSEQTSNIGVLVAAIFTCVYFIFSFESVTSTYKEKFKKESNQVRLILTFIFYSFMLFCFWVATAHSIPAAYTRLIGDSYTTDVGVTTTSKHKKNSCSYRIEGGVIKRAFPTHICISRAMYETKSNKYRLSGLSSHVGVLIKNATPI